ncbi:AraC family transcriptional regulator [Spirosoma humi]
MNTYRRYFNGQQALPDDDSEPNWGVSILNVGHNLHPADKPYPDHEHPNFYLFNWEEGRILEEFQLVYISRGSGTFETRELPPSVVEAGTAFLLFPGVWHRFRPSKDTGWEEFWVGFKGLYPDYLMQQACFAPDRPLIRTGFDTELLNVFVKLIETLRTERTGYKQLSSCLVIQLLGLIYASALMKAPSQSEKEKKINGLRFQLHERWDENLNMESFAQANGVGYVWFRKAFNEITGTPPARYHLALKMEKARQLLTDTNLLLSEIASRTGFESEFYFSKLFKKKFGVNPSTFRKQHSRMLRQAFL